LRRRGGGGATRAGDATGKTGEDQGTSAPGRSEDGRAGANDPLIAVLSAGFPGKKRTRGEELG